MIRLADKLTSASLIFLDQGGKKWINLKYGLLLVGPFHLLLL